MEQDQTVQSEEEQTGATGIAETVPAVEGTGVVGEDKSVSVEDILGVKSEDDIAKGKAGTPPWYQKRIDELTKDKNVAKSRVKELEAEKSAPSIAPAVPVSTSYETDEEYQVAMGKWYDDRTAYTQAQTTIKQRENENYTKESGYNDRFLGQIEELKANYPTAEEDIAKTDYGVDAQNAIRANKHSGRIALYYQLNPDKLAQLKTLDSEGVKETIGELGYRFGSIGKQNKQTKAPAAINPITGGDSSVADVPLSDIKNDDAWYKEYNRQRLNKLKKELG